MYVDERPGILLGILAFQADADKTVGYHGLCIVLLFVVLSRLGHLLAILLLVLLPVLLAMALLCAFSYCCLPCG